MDDRIYHGKLVEVGDALPDAIDVFICSASFEARCLSIPRQVAKGNVGTTLIVISTDHKHLYGSNVQELFSFFSQAKDVETSTTHPLVTADSLSASLQEATNGRTDLTIVVDITTFTHEGLLILFRLLERKYRDHTVKFFYSDAKEYSVNEEARDKWLSRGIRDVRSVLGFPGLHLPSRSLHVVVLVGFERDRVMDLITAYEPAVISLGYGRSTGEFANQHGFSSREVCREIRQVYGHAFEFEFSCFDPFATKAAVFRALRAHPDCNVVMAPMSTKMSTLGAAMVACQDESVQLCYSTAIKYNYRAYSDPGENVCALSLRDLLEDRHGLSTSQTSDTAL